MRICIGEKNMELFNELVKLGFTAIGIMILFLIAVQILVSIVAWFAIKAIELFEKLRN